MALSLLGAFFCNKFYPIPPAPLIKKMCTVGRLVNFGSTVQQFIIFNIII